MQPTVGSCSQSVLTCYTFSPLELISGCSHWSLRIIRDCPYVPDTPAFRPLVHLQHSWSLLGLTPLICLCAHICIYGHKRPCDQPCYRSRFYEKHSHLNQCSHRTTHCLVSSSALCWWFTFAIVTNDHYRPHTLYVSTGTRVTDSRFTDQNHVWFASGAKWEACMAFDVDAQMRMVSPSPWCSTTVAFRHPWDCQQCKTYCVAPFQDESFCCCACSHSDFGLSIAFVSCFDWFNRVFVDPSYVERVFVSRSPHTCCLTYLVHTLFVLKVT